jgi:hypothetical protein
VNATSVAVTLSTSGDTFILLSPSYDLSVATSSGGVGTAAISCSGAIESAVLSQSTGMTVYTITPADTSNCATASPPVIASIAATNLTTNSATITWTTNVAADSTVSYGTTPSYGATSTDPTLLTAHSVLLTNLNASTIYYYAVASSEYGTSTTSGNNTFTTAAVTSGGVSTGGGGSAYDLSIDNGVATTATTSVTLSLYGTAAYTMEVSNVSDFVSSTWIPYVTSMPWMLASGTGEQTVYVQFRAVSGSIVGNTEASIDLTASSVPAPASAPTSSATIPTLASTTTSSAASLTAELAALQVELAALLKQAGQSSATPTPTHFVFTRNLYFGITGNDVKQLQLFLISQDAGPAARKLAAHGTTTYFASLTRAALIELQQKAGITPAIGYFGPVTRGWVNAHD